ncbi:MAG: nicotinate-nucleotide adenylyltransferase [Candidatus Omnitrophica bacterium]|nr:nicotinate-nucleotide adenylyltransferase [Candidatus Omnitrophota bacterium]
MRLGILGGTFNPVHLGHLILAEEVREKKDLDRILFIPTFLPPHKTNGDIAAAGDRLQMVKAAIKGNRSFGVSDIEIRRKGPSYTIDTATALKKQYPEDELFFIIGSDLLNYLDEWKDLRQIAGIVSFIVATRPGYPLENISRLVSSMKSGISTIPIRAVDISAFQIRECIRRGRSFRYLVPEAVFEYIEKKKLYR